MADETSQWTALLFSILDEAEPTVEGERIAVLDYAEIHRRLTQGEPHDLEA